MDSFGPHNPLPAVPDHPRNMALADPSEVLQAIFSLLDREAIPCCVGHGYENLPDAWGSDVDIVVGRTLQGAGLERLLTDHQPEIGARLVRRRGLFVTLACRPQNGIPRFLLLDFSHDETVGRFLVCPGEAMLPGRRRRHGFWVPSAPVAFECLLMRALLKRKLDISATAKLSKLFAEDPAGVTAALRKRWANPEADALILAAASADWNAILGTADTFRRRIEWVLQRSAPLRTVAQFLSLPVARIGRVLKPGGISVVLLGPDGAGKSSAIAALETGLAPLFARTEVKGFAPSLRQLLRRPPTSTAVPHGLPPRSLQASLLRAAYWAAYGLASHVTGRWQRARSTLVLHDRHFIDILVDPVRYRYGGPKWVLKLIWRLMAKPDHVILLHGPASVLQARKKELTVAETERQCHDYLMLVRPLPYGHVIDAAQPFEGVVNDACAAILEGP